MIPVIFLSINPDTPPRGYWDMGIIEDFFANNLWATGYDFYIKDVRYVPDEVDGAVIVFPARAQVEFINDLNSELSKLKWVVLLLTGDEESSFPVEEIKHDNIKIWVMSPRPGRHDEYGKLGTGYPPQINQFKTIDAPDKDMNWFFAGQITHDRRKQCADQLENMSDKNGILLKTGGFTQGFEHGYYYGNIMHAKVTPAPSGPETPDSFRLFESLELAAVPIADTKDPKGVFPHDYWTYFFGEEPPFPVITDYEQLPGYIEDAVNQYPKVNNDVFSWWISKKRQLSSDLVKDIFEVSKVEPKQSQVTIIIPTSPIKSHPDTEIIDETIQSIRHHFPTAEIIITFDGVRPEQEDRRADYEEFTRRLLWKCNVVYKNILPIVLDEHKHQTGAAKIALQHVKTPLILYVEQDTPLVLDEPIQWEGIINELVLGNSNMVRLHHEAVIPKDHLHMIHGIDARTNLNLMMTSQWSQRPHVATTAFYRRILQNYFSDNAKSFIEDKMHGVVHEAYILDGMLGWEQFKIHIYAPEGNMKRSYHTDGRAGEAKFDDSQVF